MSCNAVATVYARVKIEDRIMTLIPTEAQKTLILQYLKSALKLDVSVYSMGDYTRFYSPEVDVYVYNTGEISLKLNASNRWNVSPEDQAKADRISQGLKTFLTAAAGLAFQNKVKIAASKLGRIEGEQRTAQGALVINLDI